MATAALPTFFFLRRICGCIIRISNYMTGAAANRRQSLWRRSKERIPNASRALAHLQGGSQR